MITNFWKKLVEKKLLFIMLVVGIAIMLIPKEAEKNISDKRISLDNVNRIEVEKLEKILEKIVGVESCDVFITYDDQGENKFAYDVHDGNGKDLELKLSDREPLLVSVNNPEIRGVFVLIKGDNVDKYDVVRIIKGATGTPMHRICVEISEED